MDWPNECFGGKWHPLGKGAAAAGSSIGMDVVCDAELPSVLGSREPGSSEKGGVPLECSGMVWRASGDWTTGELGAEEPGRATFWREKTDEAIPPAAAKKPSGSSD